MSKSGADERPRPWRSRALRVAMVLLPMLVAGLISLLLLDRSGGGAHMAAAGCNGPPGLCGKRLNEVVFAGTHNSFAAADEPGWHFANQRYRVARQLDDGIRALLLDIHFGLRDPSSGRVRTDLRAEGSDRNKLAKVLPASALRLADRLAGRVGHALPAGTPVPYLCHTLCELGAEPLDQELEVLRTFLERHPRQLLIVIVEDYVPPATIEGSFEKAGLLKYVATLNRRAALPTLGTLIGAGHRLVVFAEKEGGSPSWYMPAFSFIQDTPLGARLPGRLSCARFRGEPDSPILLMNHWVDTFPPQPALNRPISGAEALRRRITRCEAERGRQAGIVAVDFYEQSKVVQVADQLNRERAESP